MLSPDRVIVLCRRVNIADASLPTLLYQRRRYRTRGVIVAELLADDVDLRDPPSSRPIRLWPPRVGDGMDGEPLN